MGYKNEAIGAFNITATPFLQVGGGEAWTLGDIVPNENWIELGDLIQTFTADGKAGAAYMYLTPASAAMYDGVEAGWYKTSDFGATTPMNDVSIPFTVGYVAKSGAKDASLTFSGQVKQTATEIPVGGFTITANVTPVDLTLGDIVPNENWIELGDLIQTFTADGKAGAAYMYLTPASAAMYDGVEAGWYKTSDFGATTPMNDVLIPAGSGFVAKSGAKGATLTLPSPLAE